MRTVLADLDRWWQEGENIAMATLVRARGSAPRLPGSRLCVTRSGKMTGSVSGGCIETDVFERAQRVIETGVAVMATYGVADDAGLRVGLTCGGSVDVLIQPITAAEPWKTIRGAQEEHAPFAAGTALEPDALRGRSLVVVNGSVSGSIDASLDPEVVAESARLAADGGTRVLRLSRGTGEEDAVIFVEAVSPPPDLFIVGATHTASALAEMAGEVGFRVVVIDPRSMLATRERFPGADEIVHEWPAAALDRLHVDSRAHVVALAHDPKFDIPALACALRSRAAYVGAIGSRRTAAKRKQMLAQEGLAKADLGRIHTPIGLDIGARTPEEIALAILAEMMAVRSGHAGGSLRDARHPIHGRQ